MNDKIIASYIAIAAEDLEGARALVTIENRNASYLLEQAAEKIIRAVLTSENVHAGVKHDLTQMVASLRDGHPLKPQLELVTSLERFATSYRYRRAAAGFRSHRISPRSPSRPTWSRPCFGSPRPISGFRPRSRDDVRSVRVGDATGVRRAVVLRWG